MRNTKTTETLLLGILLLFFLQALSDFIQSIYAFGLLVTAFTVEVASIVLLFTPLLLLFFRKVPSRLFLIALAYIAILARLIEPALAPGARLAASGLSVGAFMLLFPLVFHSHGTLRGWRTACGALLALGGSILFRTAGSGLDISESGMFQIVSWVLGIFAAVLVLRMDWSNEDEGTPAAPGRPVTAFAIGTLSVFIMLYFVLMSPTVLARWTGISLAPILFVLLAALLILSLLLRAAWFLSMLSRPFILGWNAVFILLLILTILPHQVSLPLLRDLYPIDAPAPSPLASVWLYLMLLASPVIFLDLRVFLRQISLRRPSLPQLGGAFAAAALYLLVMVFFHVFTTIYDYAPVIGPLFRDRFWLVHLLAGLGLLLPLLLVREEAYPSSGPEAAPPSIAWLMAGMAVLTLAAFLFTASLPRRFSSTGELKVMTYNIQQGFDEAGNQNLEGQLAVIRAVGPDILGLEESDTARVANGNVDAVRFIADQLDMYSYYGPTTTTGTFGIALLSRYPIEDPSTFFMYSEAEQTAAIHARVEAEGRTWNVFVTHLGNHGPIVQLEDMLTRVDGLENVIAMGDFNFRPATEQYTLMTASLQDSWLLKWPGGTEIPGYSAERRIDHIFVSPGTQILDSAYVVDPASDHPYMYSVIAP